MFEVKVTFLCICLSYSVCTSEQSFKLVVRKGRILQKVGLDQVQPGTMHPLQIQKACSSDVHSVLRTKPEVFYDSLCYLRGLLIMTLVHTPSSTMWPVL